MMRVPMAGGAPAGLQARAGRVANRRRHGRPDLRLRSGALTMRSAAALLVALGPALAALAVPGGADAQVDPGAPEGALQTGHAVRDFDSYGLPVGPFGLDGPATRTVEGAVSWSAYRLDDPQASVAGVMKGYRERLHTLGFSPVFTCAGEECGGFDFRFGAEILPPPGMLIDVRDFAQLTAERDDEGGWVSVLVSRVLDEIYIQTVSVEPPPPAVETPVEVTEVPSAETAPETVVLPQDERALLEQLREEGHVAVQGLEFEVGGSSLSPGSAEALDMLARMLARDDGLSVAVVGHSDNQGGLALNIELSTRRAEAVMQALIERGVPAARLEARGIGYLAPLANNATEEGRARNRRVELVLR